MRRLLGILCGLLSAALFAVVACWGAYPNNVGQVGVDAVVQKNPLYTTAGSPAGAGSFQLSSTAGAYLSSGGSAATSVPCASVLLTVSAAPATLGTTLSGGTINGGPVLPAGTVLQLSCSNLNTITLSGSGATVGYLYLQ